MTKRLMLLADEYASAYKNNLALHPSVERSRAALESALEDELSKLRGLVAGRSAEYLAAHITYDKGYEEGRLDAEAEMAGLEAPPCSDHPDAPHGFNRNASHNEGRYVCDCEGWKP